MDLETKHIMKRLHLLALSAAIACLSACIPSVNPFYTDEDLCFDARLVGRWQPEGSTDKPETLKDAFRWEFEKDGDRAYKLTVTDKDAKQGSFSAHLFKLKQDLFLDIIPTDCKFAADQIDLVGAAVMPGHLLIRVAQIEPALKLAYCDYDWLAKHLEKNPTALRHLQGNSTFLTAKTRSLQRFVRHHCGEGELFQKPNELVRVAVQPQPPKS
jgi:hypothetical protein